MLRVPRPPEGRGLINKVERMLHGLWEGFRSAQFLNLRHKRNLIGHTDDLEGEDVIWLGIDIVQGLHTALRCTNFLQNAGPWAIMKTAPAWLRSWRGVVDAVGQGAGRGHVAVNQV